MHLAPRWKSSPMPSSNSPRPSRVREQLQSVQAQWTRLQGRSEQRRRQLLASLQLQVRGRAQGAWGLPEKKA